MKPLYNEITAARRRRRRSRWMLPYRYSRWRWHVRFALIDAIGWCVFGPLKLLQSWLLPRSRRQETRSILVIQLDHLGDSLLSLGLLRHLRLHFPSARLEVICGQCSRELFETMHGVDQVHIVAVTRFCRQRGLRWLVEMLRWGWRLRRREFDLAIDVRGEFPHAVLMWLVGARRRLGWGSGGGGFLLTDRLWHLPPRHQVLVRRDILSALSIPTPDDAAPRFQPNPESLSWVDEHVVRSRHSMDCVPSRDGLGTLPRPLIVVHTSAGTQAKRWPAEHWQELIAQLMVEFNARIVLVDACQDAVAQQMSQRWLSVQDWTGRLTLVQLAAVLQRADLFVGGDSGPGHLAAAVGTPVVALFSGTNDPEEWKPWGPHVMVVRHVPTCSPCAKSTCRWADHPCMQRLRPEAVMDAIRGFLAPQFPRFPLPASRKEQPDGHSNQPAAA
jgi:lipopolysaccharide heptosyltransferase II